MVDSWFPLRFSLTFIYYRRYVLCLVYPMLPVSLDCSFLIAPSVFSNVYLLPTVCLVSCVPNVTSIWIVHSWLPLRFSLTFINYLECVLCLVYPMLPVSLDCPFLISSSVFSNVYLYLYKIPRNNFGENANIRGTIFGTYCRNLICIFWM